MAGRPMRLAIASAVCLSLVAAALAAPHDPPKPKSPPSPAPAAPPSAGATAAFPHTRVLNNGPARAYWESGHGYCGEHSVQMAVALQGVWLSMGAARRMAGGELLVTAAEGENILELMRRLGLQTAHWRNQPTKGDGLQKYMLWMKQQLLAGRGIIFPALLGKGDGEEDTAYDHLQPMLGVRSKTPNKFDPTDVFIWTTGEKNMVERAAGTPGFFSPNRKSCPFDTTNGGCIDSIRNTNAVAWGGLPDKHNIYLPVMVRVDSWAGVNGAPTGIPGDEEPEDGRRTATYTLDLSNAASKLKAGDDVTIFRYDMMIFGRQPSKFITTGSVLANQASLASMRGLCKKAGGECRSWTTKLSGPKPLVLSDASKHLGEFPADSVVYFVAIKGK